MASLRTHLIRGASGSLVLNIAQITLALVMAVVFARLLGVESFGTYAFCMSIAQILTVPVMLGGGQLLVREVSAYQAKGEYHFLRGLLLRFRQASFLAGLCFVLIAGGAGYIIYQGSPMLIPLWMALFLIPLQSVMNLQNAALRGLRYVLLSQAAFTIRPVLVIATVSLIFWTTGQKLDARAALTSQLVVSLILVILTFILLRSLLPGEAKIVKPDFEIRKWGRSALPLVAASGMQVLYSESSVVLLGILQTPGEVGLFRVAQRGAMLASLGLIAVNVTIAPTVAEMFARGEKERLQRMVSKGTLAVTAFALPVTVGMIVCGKGLISLVFGQEYVSAFVPLVILCLGQLFKAGMGSVGIILNMIGLERFTAKGTAITTVIHIALNCVLIPFYGSIGAAVATAVSLIVWNILLSIWLYRESGIVCTILPLKIKTLLGS